MILIRTTLILILPWMMLSCRTAKSVVAAVVVMLDKGLLTEETALGLVADVAGRFGQAIDAKAELEKAREQAAQRAAERDAADAFTTPGSTPGNAPGDGGDGGDGGAQP